MNDGMPKLVSFTKLSGTASGEVDSDNKTTNKSIGMIIGIITGIYIAENIDELLVIGGLDGLLLYFLPSIPHP